MTTSTVNQAPYLQTTRTFPNDPQALSVELDKAYIDTANCVNARTIGIYPSNVAGITGDSWFLAGGKQRQQTLRKVFPFSDSTLTITHGVNLSGITQFARIWGTFFDGTSWQSLPYVNVVAVTNQIGVRVTATQIIVTKGAGAPPTCANGLIVIEWLSRV